MLRKNRVQQEQGSTLVLALIFMAAFAILAVVVSNFIISDIRTTDVNKNKLQALNIAEAGVADGIYRYQTGSDTSNIVEESLGAGSYKVTFEKVGDQLERIKATGYINRGQSNEVKKEMIVDLDVLDLSGGVINAEKDKFQKKWTEGKYGEEVDEVDLPHNNISGLPTVNRNYFNKPKLEKETEKSVYEFFDNGHQPRDMTTFTDAHGNKTVNLNDNHEDNLFLANGELNLGGIDKLEADADDPAVILVNGRLEIPEQVKLENIYFITTDASHFDAPFKAENVFLHSDSNIEIEADVTYDKIELEAVISSPKGYINFGVKDDSKKTKVEGKRPRNIDLNNLPGGLFDDTIKEYEKKLGLEDGADEQSKRVDIRSVIEN
ncbi:MAG: hypothetical protein ACQEP9_07850 [Bacillota bacterium]